jgi:DNA helicase-2/ATP-dependent DNA helicase PcrA
LKNELTELTLEELVEEAQQPVDDGDADEIEAEAP